MDEWWGLFKSEFSADAHDVRFNSIRKRVGHFVPDMFEEKT
ncbi:MAG: hypothetical protein QG633_515, partial [Patescibacteria group bacterium]|nr:hypothetical protein [Patescibacteria group bacterium]